MNRSTRRVAVLSAALSAAAVLSSHGADAVPPLAGTWVLVAADDLKPDGSRVPAYGARPQGLLFMGSDGRYALQIYREDRTVFASGDKRKGTPAEYEAAVMRMSTHYGRYSVDAARKTLTFHIERAAFPNWEGTAQTRPYELAGGELSYRVPAAPDGTTPISVWQRLP
jgi:hypothetical protein